MVGSFAAYCPGHFCYIPRPASGFGEFFIQAVGLRICTSGHRWIPGRESFPSQAVQSACISLLLRVSAGNADQRRFWRLSLCIARAESGIFPNSSECQSRRLRAENRADLVDRRHDSCRDLLHAGLPFVFGKSEGGNERPLALRRGWTLAAVTASLRHRIYGIPPTCAFMRFLPNS